MSFSNGTLEWHLLNSTEKIFRLCSKIHRKLFVKISRVFREIAKIINVMFFVFLFVNFSFLRIGVSMISIFDSKKISFFHSKPIVSVILSNIVIFLKIRASLQGPSPEQFFIRFSWKNVVISRLSETAKIKTITSSSCAGGVVSYRNPCDCIDDKF